MKELHLCYLKSPKHGEFGLSHFWEYLNYNKYYSDVGNEMAFYAFTIQSSVTWIWTFRQCEKQPHCLQWLRSVISQRFTVDDVSNWFVSNISEILRPWGSRFLFVECYLANVNKIYLLDFGEWRIVTTSCGTLVIRRAAYREMMIAVVYYILHTHGNAVKLLLYISSFELQTYI